MSKNEKLFLKILTRLVDYSDVIEIKINKHNLTSFLLLHQ